MRKLIDRKLVSGIVTATINTVAVTNKNIMIRLLVFTGI